MYFLHDNSYGSDLVLSKIYYVYIVTVSSELFLFCLNSIYIELLINQIRIFELHLHLVCLPSLSVFLKFEVFISI